MTKLVYYYTIFYITVMYLLGDVLKINYLDEITSLFFLLIIFITGKASNKLFKYFFLVFIFFLIYSLLFSANPSRIGVLLDANQQIKPYIFFFFFYLFPINFSKIQIYTLRKIALIYAFISCFVGYTLDPTFYTGLFAHPYDYVNCIFSYAILYLFCSNQDKQALYITFFILTLGLLGMRTKYFANYAIFIFLFFFLKDKLQLKFRYIILLCIAIIAICYISKEKIDLYTAEGLEAGIARTYMYWNAPQLIIDYFPLGSGFASYSSWFSGEYYSPLYYKYDMDNIYGLAPENPGFTSDTFFPNLVQIGIIGIFLLFWFWKKIYKYIDNYSTFSIVNYKIGIFILAYIIIESIAGSIFVMHLIYIPMMILSIICRKSKCINKQ